MLKYMNLFAPKPGIDDAVRQALDEVIGAKEQRDIYSRNGLISYLRGQNLHVRDPVYAGPNLAGQWTNFNPQIGKRFHERTKTRIYTKGQPKKKKMNNTGLWHILKGKNGDFKKYGCKSQ
jgi:hypothetical protein